MSQRRAYRAVETHHRNIWYQQRVYSDERQVRERLWTLADQHDYVRLPCTALMACPADCHAPSPSRNP